MIKYFDEYLNESRKYDVDDLASEDCDYMGDSYRYYINKSRCTIEEWIEAGKSWAEDALDNEEIDQDRYEEIIDHYDNFEY
ncbi:hypothetical protein [uncultured Methanobrevibacter sp.]|uniref:hypothetical protein n=1 Tax=uncultured Methanobrevibacter sp. TaxID=253161 RepID=UPI0025F35040|nr:hypothetical protein [uncultured Methanobrevibacter sp.]